MHNHGKIERFNQTALNRVLRTFNGDPTVDPDCGSLQLRLRRFLFEEYNHTPHEGIDGQTPYERFSQDTKTLRFRETKAELTKHFVVRYKRRVSKDHVIRLEGETYETPSGRSMEKIIVYKHLLDNTVSVIHDGRLLTLSKVDQAANARTKRATSARVSESSKAQTSSQVKYDQDMKSALDEQGGCNPIQSMELK